jgi:hypothetical protein
VAEHLNSIARGRSTCHICVSFMHLISHWSDNNYHIPSRLGEAFGELHMRCTSPKRECIANV